MNNIGIDILHNLDMNRYQILNLVLQNLGTAPTGTIPEGFIYYNTAQKRTLQWNGTSWISIGGDYVLPIASTGALGGVKVNSSNATITIDQTTGVLEVLNNKHSHQSSNITDATSANTASMIVKRDGSGNFTAGTITAALSGNAATATKLQTAHTIGGVSFDGTADINLPGVNIAGNQNTSGNAASATKLQTTRAISLSGDVTGTANFDGTAPASIASTLATTGVSAGQYTLVTVDTKGRVTAAAKPTALEGLGITGGTLTGNLTVSGVLTGALTGNAASATKWKTARTVSLTGDVTGSASVDGTANASIASTLAASGVSAGQYTLVTVDTKGRVTAAAKPTTLQGLGLTSGTLSGNLTVGGTLTANASSATKWQTARTITFTGAAYGVSPALDGSDNITVTLVNKNSGVTAGIYKSVTVNAAGLVTAGTNPTTLVDYGITDAAPLSHVGATGTAHGVATASVAGFMSAADKTKLNSALTAIPVASTTVLGGVKSGTDVTIDTSGYVSVVDNSHSHTIANVTSLQSALDAKIATTSISQDIATDAEVTTKVPSTKQTFDFVNSKVAGLFQFKGSIPFGQRPTPDPTNVGWTYNISNPFTTDATFVEGPNKSYPSGTNIVVINSNGYKWDVLAGTIDLSSYYTKDKFEGVLKGATFTLAAGQTEATFYCPGIITSATLYNADTGNMIFTKLLYGNSGTSVKVTIASAQTFNIIVATAYIAFDDGGLIPCSSCDYCEGCDVCEGCDDNCDDCDQCDYCEGCDDNCDDCDAYQEICGKDGWQEECSMCIDGH